MDPLKFARSAAKQVIQQAAKARGPSGTPKPPEREKGVHGFPGGAGADGLLARFLKLQASDPGNSVETKNALQKLAGQMRAQGAEHAENRLETAKEAMRKAKLHAGGAGLPGKVLAALGNVVAVSTRVITLGASAPQTLGVAAASAGLFLAKGGAKGGTRMLGATARQFLDLADRAGKTPTSDRMMRSPGLLRCAGFYPKPEGASSGLAADRLRKMSEMMQQLVEEESDIIKQIMESKNDAIGAVMRMLQQSHAAQTKVGSAGMKN